MRLSARFRSTCFAICFSLSASAYRGCQALSTGFYHIVSEPIANGATATVLVPLRYANESTWTGQRNLFPASASIPAQVQVLEQPTNFPVKVSGADCCWLDAAGNAQPVWVQWLKLLCYGLFFLVLLTMLNQAARLLSLRTSLLRKNGESRPPERPTEETYSRL